jgi:hypothetical protein
MAITSWFGYSFIWNTGYNFKVSAVFCVQVTAPCVGLPNFYAMLHIVKSLHLLAELPARCATSRKSGQ